ncbi:MAG: hypothetical protein WCK28_08145 [Burkholderiales bacterium]
MTAPDRLPVRAVAAAYAVVLGAVALLNQVPGLADAEGRVFGVFALDLYDDLLHGASALWAAAAAVLSRRASLAFLRLFGTLYLADGLLGLATGSGYLDLGIVLYGVQALPLGFKVLANAPHLLLGGLAMAVGLRARARAA